MKNGYTGALVNECPILVSMVLEKSTEVYTHSQHNLLAPFGFMLANQITFSRSVFDSQSALVKTLTALHFNGPLTKAQIMVSHLKCDMNVRVNGWRASWFAGLTRAGFTEKKGMRFYLTAMGREVVMFHQNRKFALYK